MKHCLKPAVGAMLLLLFFIAVSPIAYATVESVAMSTKTAFNMTFAYGVTSIAALLLAIGYWGAVKNKNTWLQLLFISVVIVNIGYFALAISDTLSEALLANRISYLGAVFLPLCMLMTIMDVCKVKYKRLIPAILLVVSVLVFLIAASPGYLDCYYSEVSLVFINDMAKLVKVYGPLHAVYRIYLVSYLGLMIGTILISRIKHKMLSQKHALLLLLVALLNIIIWAVEQLIYTEFELLSVSYIISELLLLVLYSIMQDYGVLTEEEKLPASEEAGIVSAAAESEIIRANDEVSEQKAMFSKEEVFSVSEKWAKEYILTNREVQVLIALLQNKRRKEIAAEFNVTEHTIKKHTGNIFSKLGISSRAELFKKINQEKN